MPKVSLREVLDQVVAEMSSPDEQEQFGWDDDLPFVYDEGEVFLFVSLNGSAGVLLHSWERNNRIQLGNLESILGSPNVVEHCGSDYPLPGDDEAREYPNTTAVWFELTSVEVRDLISRYRKEL